MLTNGLSRHCGAHFVPLRRHERERGHGARWWWFCVSAKFLHTPSVFVLLFCLLLFICCEGLLVLVKSVVVVIALRALESLVADIVCTYYLHRTYLVQEPSRSYCCLAVLVLLASLAFEVSPMIFVYFTLRFRDFDRDSAMTAMNYEQLL